MKRKGFHSRSVSRYLSVFRSAGSDPKARDEMQPMNLSCKSPHLQRDISRDRGRSDSRKRCDSASATRHSLVIRQQEQTVAIDCRDRGRHMQRSNIEKCTCITPAPITGDCHTSTSSQHRKFCGCAIQDFGVTRTLLPAGDQHQRTVVTRRILPGLWLSFPHRIPIPPRTLRGLVIAMAAVVLYLRGTEGPLRP